jgi:hypothetical protein
MHNKVQGWALIETDENLLCMLDASQVSGIEGLRGMAIFQHRHEAVAYKQKYDDGGGKIAMHIQEVTISQ